MKQIPEYNLLNILCFYLYEDFDYVVIDKSLFRADDIIFNHMIDYQ